MFFMSEINSNNKKGTDTDRNTHSQQFSKYAQKFLQFFYTYFEGV